MLDVASAQRFVTDSLSALADPETARGMARYMKSTMPCYGVKKPARVAILRELRDRWIPQDEAEYRQLVAGLWSLPHREEKYLAIGAARAHRDFVTTPNLPLYRRMIIEGAWWDFVDEVAITLVGQILLADRATVTPTIREWIGDPDRWVRRTAIICQIGHKNDTDPDLLFDACTRLSTETDFFIRKAIGWSLRAYGAARPDAVRAYVHGHEAMLSGLSRREALKHL